MYFVFDWIDRVQKIVVTMSDWDTVPITLRKRVAKGAAAKSEKVVPIYVRYLLLEKYVPSPRRLYVFLSKHPVSNETNTRDNVLTGGKHSAPTGGRG